MKFSDIPSHEHVKERLRALVDSDRLPHALLLEGPAGIGKFSMARALAQYVHCTERTGGEPCGHCPSCIQHQTFNHVDTIYSFPILKNGASTAVSDDYIDEWRDFLTESPYMNFGQWQKRLNNINGQPVIYVNESQDIMRKLSFTSHASKYKIVIMWLPERMNVDCANKLLKLIEEPLPGTLLFFVSNNSREILPTIYSRLQRIEMKRLPDDVVSRYLLSVNPSLSDADAMAIAHQSEGSILSAEKNLTMNEEAIDFLNKFMSLMRLAYARKVAALRKWSVEVASLGREQETRFLDYCNRMMRENFMCNLRIPELVYLNTPEREFSSRFAPFINERNVERLVRAFSEARRDISANGNAKIIFFDLAVRVILLIKQGQ